MSRISAAGQRRCLLAAVVIAAVAAAWFWISPRPEKLVEKGLAAARRDPAAAERFVRRAIVVSGGRYPDGELALCVLFANRGDWDAAAAQFEAIDISACRPDLLLTLGRAALQSERGSLARQAL